MSTLVFLHAHPDDEALWTGGTMAEAARRGHRVVLVTATDGAAGVADLAPGDALAETRVGELERSARALGVARLVRLGHHDSGHHVSQTSALPGQTPFSTLDVGSVAARVAEILAEEQADLLVGYDAQGGYGHVDHVMVHRVARRAAELHPVRLLESTLPRELVLAAVRTYGRLRPMPYGFDISEWSTAFTPWRQVTHVNRVGRSIAARRAAMQAHASQAASSDGTLRTMDVLLRLPAPAFRLAFGREFFHEPGAAPTRHRPDLVRQLS